MFENVFDMHLQEKRHEAAIAVKEQDYSQYKFRFDAGALKADDTQVVLMLLTVAQTIPWMVVKSQIEAAIEHKQLQEWIIEDVLMEANSLFFDKYAIAKTMKNIYRIEEGDLVDAFSQIANQVSY